MSEQDERDSKQFLQEVLYLPSGAPEPSPPPPPNSRVGGDPRHRMRKGGMEARPGSIQFLRENILPHSHLHAVTLEGTDGFTWECFCFLEQDERGFWHGRVSAGVVSEHARRSMRYSPWVRMFGGSGEETLWAGGYITEKAPDAHLVRLICKNGLVVEDTVQDGIVLFQAKQRVELSIQVEIYTRSGELLGVQSFLDYASYGTP